MTPNLAGKLVCLRAWRPGEGPALEPVCVDEGIGRFTSVPRAYSALDAEAWIARQERRRIAGEAIVLAINERGTARPVGMVGLFGLDSPDQCGRLGYWLIRGWRGRGLAREQSDSSRLGPSANYHSACSTSTLSQPTRLRDASQKRWARNRSAACTKTS